MRKPITSISIKDLSEKEALVYLFETVKALGWRNRFISDAGVIAYTDNGEFSWNGEITVKLEGETASMNCVAVSGMVSDFGHTERAVAQYLATFEKVKGSLTDDEIRNLYKAYEKDFVPAYEDVLKPDTRPKVNILNSFWSFFKPSGSYFFTPILVLVNVLVYIIMICSGVAVFDPDAQSMVSWGANATVATLDGQWWRLLTSCFLHFGLIHLLLNMYALVFVGWLLEPYLGKTKFIIAYLLTGITASVISLWWHDYTVSAGASGAIFGLYGVFIAILSTNHIEPSMRKGLLTNIGIFVVYNLVYGSFKPGIDNAAHTGGLLSGIIVGFLFIPSFKKPGQNYLHWLTLAGTTLILSTAGVLACVHLAGNDRLIYFKRMAAFYKLEEAAVTAIENKNDSTEAVPAIKKGIAYWQQGAALIIELDRLDLSATIHRKNQLLVRYCRLRIRSYQLMRDAYQQHTYQEPAQVHQVNREIRQVMDKLSAR